ncbi:MAG: TadE/TadG family type IV pilus assembly protein [Janthinobacterium lividum]
MAANRGFRQDAGGAIAVEFAFIAPVMLLLLFGAVSAMKLARVNIKLWNAGQSIADLVSQQTTLTTSSMTDFCNGGTLALAPVTGALAVSVASVTTSATGTTAVDWLDATCGSSGMTSAAALSLGTPYVPNPKDSVIVVQVSYAYAFPASYLLPKSVTLTRRTYSRPRAGTSVLHG